MSMGVNAPLRLGLCGQAGKRTGTFILYVFSFSDVVLVYAHISFVFFCTCGIIWFVCNDWEWVLFWVFFLFLYCAYWIYCLCLVRAPEAINLYMQRNFACRFMMCFTSAQFRCVLCVLMCVCVCVCVCVCGAGQPSLHNTKNNFTCGRTEVSRYTFFVRACVCVRLRSRACAHVIFVRSCNCVAFFLLFLPCYNLLLVRAQFLWSPVIVFFFFRRWCVIFLLWVCVYVRDRLVACECVRAQCCERLNYVLFFLLLPLLVCYIFIVCAYVWDRVPVLASLFLRASTTILFSVRHRSCDIFCCGCTRKFVRFYNCVCVFFRCWCVMFFLWVCDCVWGRVTACARARSLTLAHTYSHALTRTPHSITHTRIHSHSALSLTH